MATQTQINVNVKVDDKQVNTAVKSTENLRKEIKRLEVELTKVEIGSKEFENLSEQLKDNKDKLELVRAKSRDLFDSFSMLPGPIGQIGTSINSTSDKLKIFSAFNLKDIKGQFKAVGEDIKQVAGNLGKATGITKLYESTVGGLTKVFSRLPIGMKAASTAASGFGKALIATGIGAIVVVVGQLIANFETVKKVMYNLIPGLKAVGDAIGSVVNFFTDLIGVTSAAERAEEARQKRMEQAKANSEIKNKAIQREIDVLTAAGATAEEIDAKRLEMERNTINALKKGADDKGKLYGEDAEAFKTAMNNIKVIKTAAKKREEDEAKAAANEAAQKRKSRQDKELQQEKEFLQSQADARVQNIKDSADTDEAALREALKKQYELKNQGKKLSVEVQEQQAAEIDRIVKEELQKDKEARKKANDDKIKSAQDTSKLIVQTIDVELETLKLKYGEDSKEYRSKLQEKFDEQKRILNEEESFLKSKEATKDGLTEEEKRRLKEIQNERQALANTVEATNQAQEKSDKERLLKSFNDQIALLNLQNESLNMLTKEYWVNRGKILDEQMALELEGVKKGSEEELAILKKYAKLKEQLKQDEVAAYGQVASAVLSSVANLGSAIASSYDEEAKTSEAAFEKRKKLQIGTALISAASGIIQILTQPSTLPSPLDFITKALNAGALAISTGIQISKIKSTKFEGAGASPEQPRKLAYGGIVSGPGGSRSDLVPAMLSNGESVINAESTAMFRPLLSSINAMGGGKRFADGGLSVGGFSQDQALSQLQNTLQLQQPPIKTYVVSSDMTNQQMMDRAIKDRSTL